MAPEYHSLSPDVVAELESHNAVRRVIDTGNTVVVLDWEVGTETVAELVDIAGRDGTIRGGDTRIHLSFPAE